MASITHTVGGTDNLVSFKSAARVPIESLKVHFSPIQEGEGDPSPENVRPISGWDGIEVYHAGKNLLKYWKNGYYSSTRGYFVSVQNNASFYPIKVKSTDVLYFSINSPVGYSAFYFFTDPFNMNNNTYISGEQYHSSAQTGRYVKKIQPPQDCWLVFQIDYGSPRTAENAYEKKPQLEFESFSNGVSLGATDYEPYCGEILPITFPVVGKNKFNGEFTHYNIGSDGTVLASDAKRISSLYIPVSHGTYTLSSNENFPFAIYVYENNNESSYLLDESLINWTNSPATFTINNGQYISIKWKNFENTEINISDISNVQLELGTEATAYEPYNSDNTVYGGYIDLAKGEVVATYFHYILNGTETGWLLDGSGDTSRRTYIDTARFNTVAKAKGKLFSNYCKTSGSSIQQWWGWISSTGTSNSCHILFYIPATIDTVDKWKAYLSENPLEIVYELTEPIHYPLTPNQCTTFLNTNNFWSNTNGPTEVSYAIHDSEQIRSARKRILAAAPKIEEVSGSIATFNTDINAPLKECKAYFEPIQDLHGYDRPWVGGSGRNIFHVTAQSQTSETGVVFTVNSDGSVKAVGNPSISTPLDLGTITLPAGTYKIQGGINNAAYLNIPSKVNSYGGAASFTIAEGGETITPRIYITANKEVNGTFYPMIKAESDNNADWAPYENICPIEGWDGIKTEKCGKNLFNALNATSNTSLWAFSEGTWSTSYVGSGNSTYKWGNQIFTPGTYTFSAKFSGQGIGGLRFLCSSPTCNGTWNNTYQGYWKTMVNGEEITFSVTEPCKIGLIFLTATGHAGEAGTAYNIQLEKGSVATDYESYSGLTLNIGGNKLSIGTTTFTRFKQYKLEYPILPGEYTISATIVSTDTDKETSSIMFPNGQSSGSNLYVQLNRDNRSSKTFTLYNPCNEIYLYSAAEYSSSEGDECTWTDVQLESGSVATDYQPYNYIYGGYVDLIKGKIVAEWKIADMGDFNYGINTVLTGVDRYDVYITDFKGNNSHDAPDLISELFKAKDIYSANNEYATWVVSTIENHLYFYTPAGTYENQTAFKTAVTGKKIVYKLKTPIEYDIDPSILKTLRNTNNIWSNANGDIQVKYWTH